MAKPFDGAVEAYEDAQTKLYNARQEARSQFFKYHRCWKCQDGTSLCRYGNPLQCDFPHARND